MNVSRTNKNLRIVCKTQCLNMISEKQTKDISEEKKTCFGILLKEIAKFWIRQKRKLGYIKNFIGCKELHEAYFINYSNPWI